MLRDPRARVLQLCCFYACPQLVLREMLVWRGPSVESTALPSILPGSQGECLTDMLVKMETHPLKLVHLEIVSGVPLSIRRTQIKRGCFVGADRKPHQRTFIRLHSAPLTTLMVATYVPPAACSADKGDLFTLLGIMNKQDYARWHSCEFVLGAKTFDPSLRPPGHPEVCMAFIVTPVLLLSALPYRPELASASERMQLSVASVVHSGVPSRPVVIFKSRALVLLICCGSLTRRHYADIEGQE